MTSLRTSAIRRLLNGSACHITAPPLTPKTCPVMKPDSSEQRKPTAAAMSAAVPKWPNGMLLASCSLEPRYPAAWPWCCMGVSMPDGGMLFTVIPCGAYSRASDLVNVITPPLDAAEWAANGAPRWALDDEIITILPHFAATMSGSATWQQ